MNVHGDSVRFKSDDSLCMRCIRDRCQTGGCKFGDRHACGQRQLSMKCMKIICWEAFGPIHEKTTATCMYCTLIRHGIICGRVGCCSSNRYVVTCTIVLCSERCTDLSVSVQPTYVLYLKRLVKDAIPLFNGPALHAMRVLPSPSPSPNAPPPHRKEQLSVAATRRTDASRVKRLLI